MISAGKRIDQSKRVIATNHRPWDCGRIVHDLYAQLRELQPILHIRPHEMSVAPGRKILEKVVGLEKISGDLCPRCGLQTLTIYYEDETDLQLGARCEECGFKGFFMLGKLIKVANA